MAAVIEHRPCHGMSTDHVPHPWGYGRYRCKGAGRYAEDAQPPRAVAAAGDECGHRYVGTINGSVFVCRAPKGHPTDPSKGYAGSGHNMVGVSRAN